MAGLRKAPGALPRISLLAALVLCGCAGDNLSSPVANFPPTTTITGAPAPFSRSKYVVDLHWLGEDPDGEVISFEIAWEDTATWEGVARTDSTFFMQSDSCCAYDTLETAAGADSVVERFYRYHTFFVRAVDNRGAVDPTPAHITFNSATVAPSTRLTGGPVRPGSTSGTAVRFEWEGTDPDGPPDGVVAYEYFHATNGILKRDYGYVPARDGGPGVTREIWKRLDWIRVPAESAAVILSELDPTAGDTGEKLHLFFVRSIDEAGAVEQIPVRGANFVEWGVSDEPPGYLVIRSNLLGIRASSRTRVTVGKVFEGTPLLFSWRGDFGQSGGAPAGYSHAYDNLLWTSWEVAATRYPPGSNPLLPGTGRHTLLVKARDGAGMVLRAEFPFEVFPAPAPDGSAILHWNDFFVENDPSWYPGPERYISFWRDTLLAGFDQLDVFDPRAAQNHVEAPCRQLGRTSTLVITTDDWNGSGRPYLSQVHLQGGNPIWSYVEAGGNLLVLGFQPSWNFLPDLTPPLSPGPMTDPGANWPPDGPIGPYRDKLVWYSPLYADSLHHPMYEYCAVETTWINTQAYYPPARNFLRSARSMQPDILPDLTPDSSRTVFWRFGQGLAACERYTLRDDRETVPLYRYCYSTNPAAVAEGGDPCSDAGRPAGLFIPSDGKRGHVAFLGMPLYYFEPEQAREAVRGILVDLFGETPLEE